MERRNNRADSQQNQDFRGDSNKGGSVSQRDPQTLERYWSVYRGINDRGGRGADAASLQRGEDYRADLLGRILSYADVRGKVTVAELRDLIEAVARDYQREEVARG